MFVIKYNVLCFCACLIASDNNWAIIWCKHGFTFMDKQLQLTAISQKKIVVKIFVHIPKTVDKIVAVVKKVSAVACEDLKHAQSNI